MKKIKIQSWKALNFSGFPGFLSPSLVAEGVMGSNEGDKTPTLNQFSAKCHIAPFILSLLCNFR